MQFDVVPPSTNDIPRLGTLQSWSLLVIGDCGIGASGLALLANVLVLRGGAAPQLATLETRFNGVSVRSNDYIVGRCTAWSTLSQPRKGL